MLNSLHPKIQFTMKYDNKKLPFLDILLYKKAERLESDIYITNKRTHTDIWIIIHVILDIQNQTFPTHWQDGSVQL
jgi:hypothetical protein